jgi:hypothetical protein
MKPNMPHPSLSLATDLDTVRMVPGGHQKDRSGRGFLTTTACKKDGSTNPIQFRVYLYYEFAPSLGYWASRKKGDYFGRVSAPGGESAILNEINSRLYELFPDGTDELLSA